jgi:lipoprotein-anchoring transpeptidase ErfK/SrfK
VLKRQDTSGNLDTNGRVPMSMQIRFSVLLLAAGFAIAGCTGDSDAKPAPAAGPGNPATASSPALNPAVLAFVPAAGAADVAPGETVSVAVTNGKVGEVKLTGADGKKVAGKPKADGSGWESSEPLGYGKSYTVNATATGADGKPVTAASIFTTIPTPAHQVSVSVNLADGETVGVGMPLIFTFSGKVADKSAVEKALKISADPQPEGAFHWFGDKSVTWRPKDYWSPGTKITMNAAIYGKNLGNGTFGSQDRVATGTVGDKLVAVVDGQTHQMTVSVNDQEVKKIPVSIGKQGHNTPAGSYTVMREHNGYTMDSSTYGVPADAPGGYRTFIQYAVRMSNSGIFYHSAPWSVSSQGRSNVSHGCINLSTANAQWLMDTSKKGDIVTVQNSGGPKLAATDGWSVWQMSWDEWKSGGDNN